MICFFLLIPFLNGWGWERSAIIDDLRIISSLILHIIFLIRRLYTFVFLFQFNALFQFFFKFYDSLLFSLTSYKDFSNYFVKNYAQVCASCRFRLAVRWEFSAPWWRSPCDYEMMHDNKSIVSLHKVCVYFSRCACTCMLRYHCMSLSISLHIFLTKMKDNIF